MAKNANFVSHKKSKLKNQDGSPQLPSASALIEGEIAINFAENVETLSIKNESGHVVTFSSDNYYTEKKLGSGFTGANSAVTVTEALENKANTSDFNTHTGNTSIHHTHSNKNALDSITGNVGTMAYQAASSYSSATQVDTALGNKVDKVTGKGLSTNDYTTDEKNKLSGIASGAEVNVQSDWNATSGDAFIKNKPTIPDSFQWYGTSSTEADVVQKEVSIPSITSLKAGQLIIVLPTVTSTVADSTLKLNNFDAYPMRYGNAAITTSTDSIVWTANYPSVFVFDGSYWIFITHGYDSNTTYSSMSVAEGTTGTSTKSRSIAAVNLKQIIQALAPQSDWNATSGNAVILNKPTIPSEVTESTVSGWGFTKNVGTITGIEMNGASMGTSGVVDLGTVITDISGKVDKVTGKGLSTNDYTTDEKNKLSGITSGAEVNQNAFSNIKVGSTTIAADSKTDTLEISGSGIVTITADATNDKITISASNAVTSVAGKTGAVTLAKGDVGLGNVDNTADANKTVKAATSAQTADSAKAVALSGVSNADDLKAIEALTGTSGLLKKTAANTWTLDTNSYSTTAVAVTGAMYNSTNKTIDLKNAAGTVVSTVDATAFIKDGMVSNVEVKNVASSGTCLVITFNTDAGKDAINIPISQIFDANNYYTKADLTGSSTTVVVAKASSATTAASASSVALSNVTGADDIKAIEALTGTSGLLKKTAANTWTLDTTDYSNKNAFGKIKINAESTTIDADSTGDTLTVSGGTFISLTSDATNDKFTINVNTGTSNSTVAVGNHTHSSYENQNAFSNIKVGSTTVAAASATDTVEFSGDTAISIVGTNGAAGADKITFSLGDIVCGDYA